jgi:hypothetical protein
VSPMCIAAADHKKKRTLGYPHATLRIPYRTIHGSPIHGTLRAPAHDMRHAPVPLLLLPVARIGSGTLQRHHPKLTVC